MWLRSPSCADLVEVATSMRPQDAAEVFALRRDNDPVRLAHDLYACLPRMLVAVVAGLDKIEKPTAFLGIWGQDETGGLACANLFATADFPLLARPLIRHVRGSVIPDLLARGIRRVECRAQADYRTTRRFLTACKAKQEGPPMADYGKGGVPFVLYAWCRSDWITPDVPDILRSQAGNRRSHQPPGDGGGRRGADGASHRPGL